MVCVEVYGLCGSLWFVWKFMVCVEVYGCFFFKAMFCFIQVVGGNRQKDTKKKSLRSRKIGLEDKKGEGA